jgi:hypothetical protein
MTPALLVACLPIVCGAVSVAIAIMFPMSEEQVEQCIWAA